MDRNYYATVTVPVIHGYKVQKYGYCPGLVGIATNKDTVRLEYFPVGSPEFNAVEECWR